MLIFKFLLLVASVFTGYFLGYYLTEVLDIQRYKVFDFQALTCRPCLSFHIAWVSSTITGLLMDDWKMVGVGIGFAFFLYLGLRIDSKRRTITLDEWEKMTKEDN